MNVGKTYTTEAGAPDRGDYRVPPAGRAARKRPVPGLRVRCSPSGKKVFFYRYRARDGALREIRLGDVGPLTLPRRVMRPYECASSAIMGKTRSLRSWDKQGPYDAIVLTGSVPILADASGRASNPEDGCSPSSGSRRVIEAQIITNMGAGAYNAVALFESCIAPLKNAHPERFVF